MNGSSGVVLGTPDTDAILQHFTSAYLSMRNRKDAYGNFDNIKRVYEFLRSGLMTGDYEVFARYYDESLMNHTDSASTLIGEAFADAGVGENASYEEFISAIA